MAAYSRPDGSIIYDPTPKQIELHTSDARFRAAIGGRGSGKSQFLLWEATKYLNEWPGCHCLLLRKDFQELKKGLIFDLQRDVPSEWYSYNGQDHIAKWHNGSVLFFGHCENLSVKDLNQYLSASFSFIGVEEGGEFPYDVWDFLIGSNRNKVAGPPPTMALATNPYGIGYGWIKKLFVTKQPIAQLEESKYDPKDYFFNHSTLLDNPHLIAKDPDYINRLNLLSPDLRQKMLYGDLNSVSGAYYQNFTPSRHVINLRTEGDRIQWQSWQPRWMGSDWGLAHYWVTGWFTLALVRQFDGKWKQACVMYRELCLNEQGIDAVAQIIRDQTPESEDILHIFFSPERFNRTDPQHTPAEQFGTALRKLNLPYPARASADRVAGATFLYNMLEANELVFLDNCKETIEAIPTLVRDEKKLEDVQKPPGTSLVDDCFDMLKYGVVSMLGTKNKPQEILMREHAATVVDPIARHFYVRKRTLEIENDSEAFKPQHVNPWEVNA